MRRVGIVAVVLTAVVLLAAVAFMAVRVEHLLNRTKSQVDSEASLEFEQRTLSLPENAGFESVASPNDYTAGIVFQGKLYLAGPQGLAEFTTSAAPTTSPQPRLMRAGRDLPPAPIASMTTGLLRGDSHPVLILATTGAGILLYDGHTLGQLLPQPAAARDVTAVLALSSGDLLIGTRTSGLMRFDGKLLTIFHPRLAHKNVTALAGNEGDFWVGTRNEGVFHWHGGQVGNFDAASGLPDPQVESIAVVGDEVYVGTPMGVAEFVQGRPSRTLAPGFFAHALFADADTLTVGSIDEGVREVALVARHSSHLNSDETLQAESFLGGDGLLAVTKAGLFRRMAAGGWRRVLDSASSPLSDRNVAALGFAPDGRLWVGYFDRGLDILSADGQHAEHVEDDHVFCINRILADRTRNTMDVATANGLVLFDTTGHERQVLLRKDGLIADQVTDVALTGEGTVVATPAGLTFIDAAGMQSLYAFHGLVNNHVYTLASYPAARDSGNAQHGGLLAGTLGGISFLQQQKVRRNLTTANSGLKHNWTTAIVPVEDGWFVGTYGAGVMRLDADGRFTAMDGAAAPMEINPNAMLVTAQHVLAGSLGDGLLSYSRLSQRWSRITMGLPSLNVTALAQHDGEIYIGTDNGLVRIAEARLPQ